MKIELADTFTPKTVAADSFCGSADRCCSPTAATVATLKQLSKMRLTREELLMKR